MAIKVLRSGLALAGLATCAGLSAAPSCDLDGPAWHAGEAADFILCGDVMPEMITVDSNDGIPVELVYAQALQRCAVHDKRPGFHLVLRAAGSGKATLAMQDAGSGAPLCESTRAVAPARDLPPPPWLDAMPDREARFVDVNGVRTRYFERGDGPALVLVHGGQAGGSNNSAQKWEQNFDGLAEYFRVIALDRLAQAGTDNLPPDSYPDYFELDAQHLADFLDALRLDDVSLVGHSQGGWPVTRVALDRPGQVRCVVNVDTVMVPDDMILMSEALAFLGYASRFLDPPGGPTLYSARRGMMLRYPSGNNITLQKAQRVVDQYYSPKTAEARAAMSKARMTPLSPRFKGLKQAAYADIAAGGLQARSLIVWGELDPQVPPGLGQLFNEQLLAAGVTTELVVMPGAGHAPFIEFPDAFNGLVVQHCLEPD